RPLRTTGLARSCRLRALAAGVGLAAALAAALRTRRLRLLRRGSFGCFASFVSLGRLRLPAEPIRRGAQAAAHALRLLLLRRGGLLGFRVRVDLAADELDLRDLRAVAAAVAEAQDPRVAARPRLEARRDRVEQLRHDLAVGDVLQHEPPRVQRPAVGVPSGEAALGDRDDPLDEGAQLLRLRHRGLDVLVADQPLRLAAQHRDAMLRHPTQLPMTYSMTHVRLS